MDLHREIALWLDNFKLLPGSSGSTGSSSTLPVNASLSDVIAILRDGVVLCQLVHCLDPSSVDMTRVLVEDGSGRSVSDFLCRNNIFLFLHALASPHNFNFEQDLLFDPEDLYLCRDIGKVFRLLSELSHHEKVLNSGFAGFPRKEKQLHKRLKSERGNYEALEQMYGEAGTEDIYDSFATRVRVRDKQDLCYNEDIYQTIFPPKQPRLSLADISFGGTGKKNKRKLPIEELTTTEDKYLGNLIMVRDVFREKLSLISTADKGLIFYLLDDLILLHSDLLEGLTTTKNKDIGKVFLLHMSRITYLYGGYCVHLPTAIAHLEQVEKQNANLKKQLDECQDLANPPTFPLSSHLVIPFQRFLKYHLLLQEILKRTPDDHPDYVNLKLATEQMVKAGASVNEKKREQEECEKKERQDELDMRVILSVSTSIKLMRMENGLNLLDYGRLRKAGNIVSYTHTDSPIQRVGDYAFLFDLTILLCHRPKWLQHRYRFREAIKIRDNFLENPATMNQPVGDSGKFCVRLFSKLDPNHRVTLTLVADSQAERDSWFNALFLAMDTVNPGENAEQGHVIQMMTFAESTDCFHCGKLLQGRFFQGYRCLRCQACLHKQCLAACACLEVGTLKKTNSLMLPTALPDSMERSNSTLSLVADQGTEKSNKRHSMIRETVQELQSQQMREQENLSLDQQAWYAGELNVKTASDRLDLLPVGTYLIRQRANGQFALMLKCEEKPKGVKSMKIEEEVVDETKFYYLSQARKFTSLVKMVSYYRHKDLTENFNYEALRGVSLRTPYKDI